MVRLVAAEVYGNQTLTNLGIKGTLLTFNQMFMLLYKYINTIN